MVKATYTGPDSATLVSGIEYDVEIHTEGKAVTIVGTDGYTRYYPIENFKFDSSQNFENTVTSRRTFVKDNVTYVEVTVIHTFQI